MSESSACLEQRASGDTCGDAVPPDAPVSLCQKHLIKAYLFIQQGLLQAGQHTVVPGLRAVPEADDRVSVVYYLRFSDRIKIGTTADLKHRLIALPHDEVLALEPGDIQLERSRQQEFREHRVRGEWFRAGPSLLAHTRRIRAQHPDLMLMAAGL